MAEKQYFVTKEGLEALEKEYEHLVTVGRKDAAEKLKVARSFGDLSENSEYDEAKNDQAIMEARIADLEVMLKKAVVIDESEINAGKINVGSTVTVKIVTPDGKIAEKQYKIVGSNEADPRSGKISDESAVGKALMGNIVGAEIDVETQRGTVKYFVIDVA
ncbi:MAG: transcription elongation factor GreA [Ruminococcaceae bacterium]|nr:transcription elongation factor GreA [Oscillospiraceae bacterium]